MKLRLILFLCLILSLPGMKASAESGPSLQISNKDFDLGDVAEGAVVSHEFWVTNRGSELLKIISVEPG